MIDILMATYNGEQFIHQQLMSILQQSYQDWNLIIRDDCSTDNTVEIIKEYQAKYPEKIHLIQAKEPSGSAQNNFFTLLAYSKNEYMMFADQDDVWTIDKVQLTLEKMKQMEEEFGTDKPLLVHTDLTITDSELNVINRSRYEMHDINATRNQLNHLVVQGIVYGCTLMVNRALLDLIQDKPIVDVMHDTWLSLLAAAFGAIGYVDKPTILYRRHGGNSTGLCNRGKLHWILYQLKNVKKIHEKHNSYYRQANALLLQFEYKLNENHKMLLQEYAEMENSSLIKKASILRKYDLYREGFFSKIAQILL